MPSPSFRWPALLFFASTCACSAEDPSSSGPGRSAGSGGTPGMAGGGGVGASGGASAGVGGSSAGGAAPQGGVAGFAGSSGSANIAGSGGTAPDPDALFHAHFTSAELGPYSLEEVEADFSAAPTWDDGLGAGRATVEEEDGNRFLRVTYPNGVYGPADGGVQFIVDLNGDHEELYFSYRVRFQAGFAFNMGGKLPGLIGGSAPTGCQPDEGGFSARNMWRTGGAAVQYVYWPDQPNTCGDDVQYGQSFAPGSWQTIEHRIRMNTPGQNDGVLEGWVDGTLVLSDTARQWRKTDAFAIDALYFSTFFGGGSQEWASPQEQWADFDDLIVSPAPISH